MVFLPRRHIYRSTSNGILLCGRYCPTGSVWQRWRHSSLFLCQRLIYRYGNHPSGWCSPKAMSPTGGWRLGNHWIVPSDTTTSVGIRRLSRYCHPHPSGSRLRPHHGYGHRHRYCSHAGNRTSGVDRERHCPLVARSVDGGSRHGCRKCSPYQPLVTHIIFPVQQICQLSTFINHQKPLL